MSGFPAAKNDHNLKGHAQDFDPAALSRREADQPDRRPQRSYPQQKTHPAPSAHPVHNDQPLNSRVSLAKSRLLFGAHPLARTRLTNARNLQQPPTLDLCRFHELLTAKGGAHYSKSSRLNSRGALEKETSTHAPNLLIDWPRLDSALRVPHRFGWMRQLGRQFSNSPPLNCIE